MNVANHRKLKIFVHSDLLLGHHRSLLQCSLLLNSPQPNSKVLKVSQMFYVVVASVTPSNHSIP